MSEPSCNELTLKNAVGKYNNLPPSPDWDVIKFKCKIEENHRQFSRVQSNSDDMRVILIFEIFDWLTTQALNFY